MSKISETLRNDLVYLCQHHQDNLDRIKSRGAVTYQFGNRTVFDDSLSVVMTINLMCARPVSPEVTLKAYSFTESAPIVRFTTCDKVREAIDDINLSIKVGE